MDEKHVTADVVVACLFAGVGAWGAEVTVSPTPTYASELFGEGHASPVYPADIDPAMADNQDGTPVVMLTIPENVTENLTADPPVHGVDHNGSAEITFSVHGGTFDANVTGLMWDAEGNGAEGDVAAPGDVASIVSGGRKGDTSITIKIEEAGTAPERVTTGGKQVLYFEMPRLAGLDGLGGANSLDARADNDVKRVWLSATSRIVSGAFTDGPLVDERWPGTKLFITEVIESRDALALTIDPKSNVKTVAIDDDADKDLAAFMSVKEREDNGYVLLGTVMVEYLNHVKTAGKDAVSQDDKYRIRDGATPDANDSVVYVAKADPVPPVLHTIYDLDGTSIAEGLRGTLSVGAAGTRELFNEGDQLFIDYDKNDVMGSGEAIAIDAGMMNVAMGSALSIDPRKSDSFDATGKGEFKVYYMPGGKSAINHGAMIKLTATVDYSDPTAIDEAPAGSTTTLSFDGVNSEVMAYAIPHSTNGTGDKGNVRVRCEQPAPRAEACRVFLECWDDMGMRGFGEAPMIAGDRVMVWNGEAIEGVTGMEPTSRHSCRVLSKGMVTVQQLTRDGNSGTLVNNTYVGGGM